jgi:fluoroacetyl-CoA thioesterase
MAEPDLTHLKPGRTGTAEFVVGEEHTATRIGSGRAPVFATPMLVALMERAAVACIETALPAGQESLGVRIDVEHIAPTPAGMRVSATAKLTQVRGRTLTFGIEARDDGGLVGTARHTRVVVDSQRFRAKALAKRAKSE